MILTTMLSTEFSDYRQIFIEEYARDLASSRRCSTQEALQRATESIDLSLPQGVDTPAHCLWCLSLQDHPAQSIGYLWVALPAKSAWIYDFYIAAQWRGKGYGRLALQQLSKTLSLQGIEEIGLRVAADNPNAKSLYEKMGFAVTGYNMSKRLD